MLLIATVAFVLFTIFTTERDFKSETAIEINAPKEKVWPYLNSMKSVNSWIPWMKNQPEMVEKYEGKSGEIGDTFSWQKKNSPNYQMKEIIEEIIPYQKTRIKSIDASGQVGYVTFLLNDFNGKSKVSWVYESELSAIEKLQKSKLKASFDESAQMALENLKKTVESSK